jgi:hypothetical protein
MTQLPRILWLVMFVATLCLLGVSPAAQLCAKADASIPLLPAWRKDLSCAKS